MKKATSGQVRVGWTLLMLVLLIAGALRLEQALRPDVVGDEMLHLPSFRNHYGQSDVVPIFRKRLEAPGGVSESVRPLLLDYYELGPLAQRSLLVLMDGHPPFHPVLMELVQAATYDGLWLMRALSLVASLAGVFLAFLLGRELFDVTVGLWTAALLAVALVPVFFGGVARSYAFVDVSAAWFYLCALRACRRGEFIDGRVLGAAFLWQLVQWFSWPFVGASLGALLVFAWLRRSAAPRVVRIAPRTMALYVASSLVLLGYLLVQSRNPTLQQAGALSFAPGEAPGLFARLAPTSWFELLHDGAAAGGAAVAMVLAGVALARARQLIADRAIEVVCLWAPALTGGLLLVLAPDHVRHLCGFEVPLCLLIVLGLRAVVRAPLAVWGALAWALAGGVAAVSRGAPYHAMQDDPSPGFAATAPLLRKEIERSGRWVSYPYFVADSYYRFVGQVPPPEQPQSMAEFARILQRGAPVTVLMYRDVPLAPELRARLVPVLRVDGLASIYRLDANFAAAPAELP